jgi:battenin
MQYAGLINNVLYVIILSAALDLVGPSIPKGIVLLFDVVPSFFTKLTAPYFIHHIPYAIRIYLLVFLSVAGMLLIALTDPLNIPLKMAGVVLASLSSGLGELSFLGLTHYFGPFSLAAWGSGTGGAGIVGAGLYAVVTTGLGWSVSKSLFAFAFLPVVMWASFFAVLPREMIGADKGKSGAYARLEENEEPDDEERRTGHDAEEDMFPAASTAVNEESSRHKALSTFGANLVRAKSLFFP